MTTIKPSLKDRGSQARDEKQPQPLGCQRFIFLCFIILHSLLLCVEYVMIKEC